MTTAPASSSGENDTAKDPINSIFVDLETTVTTCVTVSASEIYGIADMTNEEVARAAAKIASQRTPATVWVDDSKVIPDEWTAFGAEVERPGEVEYIDLDPDLD